METTHTNSTIGRYLSKSIIKRNGINIKIDIAENTAIFNKLFFILPLLFFYIVFHIYATIKIIQIYVDSTIKFI